MSSVTQGERPKVSIVIPTWRRAEALRETLDSLEKQSEKNFEVVVVCDGEDAVARKFAEEYRAEFAVRWIFHEQNMGQAAARNTGANAAAGAYLLFLDDDTPGHPELVAEHLRSHVDANWRYVVYGRIVEDRQTELPHWTDRYLQERWEETLEHHQAQVGAGDVKSIGAQVERAVSCGLNCSVRRDVFLEAGGFNAKLRAQDEDMELGLRLYRAGVRFVLNAAAVVYHHNTKSMTGYFRCSWRNGGRIDAMRVFEMGQRNPQTRQIGAMYEGAWIRRAVENLAWDAGGLLLELAGLLESAANASGSRMMFLLWERICQRAEYWGGVQDAGITKAMLREAAGEPGCALMLHSLSAPESAVERTYYLSPGKFQKFMRTMVASGYETARLDEWKEGGFARKRVLLTFDDGYDDLYTELFPAIGEMKLNPVIFLVAERSQLSNFWDHTRGLRRRELLTLEQIREMQRHGVEFGSHTMRHPWLPDVSDEQLRREVRDSKHALEDMLGSEVRAFAYPYGGVDERVRAAVAEAGYKFAFTTLPGLNWWHDPLTLHRADINEQDSLLDFKLKLRSGYSPLQWLMTRARALEARIPSRRVRSALRTVYREMIVREPVAEPPRRK